MYGWMTTQNRKKLQRGVNRAIRKANKAIADDPLWRGRFYIYQSNADWIDTEGCGWRNLIITLEYVDKKTGQRVTYFGEANQLMYWHSYRLYEQMNHFIVDVCKVWEGDRDILYADKTDWTRVKVR